jgi:hypothetical protein
MLTEAWFTRNKIPGFCLKNTSAMVWAQGAFHRILLAQDTLAQPVPTSVLFPYNPMIARKDGRE